MTLRSHYDVVVVGGGHNGLVAANYLASAGQSVLLLERNHELGGATASTRMFPGMDARLSRYSYLVSLLPRTIVDELGIEFSTRRRAIASCTPYEREGEARALLLSNVDADRSRRSFTELTGDGDWRGYQELLELERTLAARVWPSLLQPLRSRAEWTASLETTAERAVWDAFVERPLSETLERLIHDDLLRGMIFTDAKVGLLTHPYDETLLQNRCFIVHVIGGGTGEWRVPVGGMGALVEALVDRARREGAEMLTGAAARAIGTGTPHHTVEFTRDGRDEAVAATRVLVNAGPQELDRLLGRPHIEAQGDEGSVCKVNMLLRRLPRLKAAVNPQDAFAGTFHVDESYGQMLASYGQAVGGSLPERPPVDIYCHTLTDDSILGADLRAAGYQSLTMFGLDAPYRLFEQDHQARRDEMLRRYLDGLNRVLAEPIEECVAIDAEGNPCIEIKTPQDLERELGLNRGNIFHQALSWFFVEDPAMAGTWGVETDVERLYRCGSSALRGGAVSGIPGRNAAACVLAELGRPLPTTLA